MTRDRNSGRRGSAASTLLAAAAVVVAVAVRMAFERIAAARGRELSHVGGDRDTETDRGLLSVIDVQARLKVQGSVHYLEFYNVIKGVTLAAAGVTLLRVAVLSWSTPRLILWSVAVVGAALAYYGTAAGAVLISFRPSLVDIAGPMMLSVVELALIWRPGVYVEQGGMPVDWFFILAVWQMTAGLVVLSVKRRLEPGRYERRLISTVENYSRSLQIDWIFAAGSGAVTLAVALSWRLGVWHAAGAARYAVLGAEMLVLAMGLRSQRSASDAISRSVMEASSSRAPA